MQYYTLSHLLFLNTSSLSTGWLSLLVHYNLIVHAKLALRHAR